MYIKCRMARVVNIRKKKGKGAAYDLYIGRRMTMGGWNLPESYWANAGTVAAAGSVHKACVAFEERVRANPEKMARLPELRGKVLGCWCVGAACQQCGKPRAPNGPTCGHYHCHGDVLVKLLGEVAEEEKD